MPTDPEASHRRSDPESSRPLDDRVRDLLSEAMGSMAFNGLRRTLNAHPESLSRALHRLERGGIVLKERGGYVLASPADPLSGTGFPRARELATLRLPTSVDPREIVTRLAGRWFGALRWVGVYDHPGDPWLVWSLEGTGQTLLLRIGERSLRVLTDPDGPLAKSAGVESAAEELLYHALGRLRDVRRRSHSSLTLVLGRHLDAFPPYAS